VPSTDGLLLAHGHFAFILKEFLKPFEISPTNLDSEDIEQNTMQLPLAQEEDEIFNDDEGIDLAKTRSSIWKIVTGNTTDLMNEYDSVFDFIEDSMPQLKKVQQLNMSKELTIRMKTIEETISDSLIKYWTSDSLGNQENYSAMLNRVKTGFMQLYHKTSQLERKFELTSSAETADIYSQLRDKVKINLMNRLQ